MLLLSSRYCTLVRSSGAGIRFLDSLNLNGLDELHSAFPPFGNIVHTACLFVLCYSYDIFTGRGKCYIISHSYV